MRTGDNAGIARRMSHCPLKGSTVARADPTTRTGPDTRARPVRGAYFIQESTTAALSFTHWTA